NRFAAPMPRVPCATCRRSFEKSFSVRASIRRRLLHRDTERVTSVVRAYRISIAARIKIETMKLIFKNKTRKNSNWISTTIVASACEWVLGRGGGRMRVLKWSGLACLTSLLLACVFDFGSVTAGLLATAHAQTVPKSIEEGGTDNAMRARKNNWT